MSWFNSVEFYVIAGTVAACVVALSALPARRGAAVERLIGGDIFPADDLDDPEAPALHAEVDSHGRLILVRRGLSDVTMAGAASLALEIVGFDIRIRERLTPGSAGFEPAGHAMFVLDFLAPERYHISYTNEVLGMVAAFTLPIRPGIKSTRSLR